MFNSLWSICAGSHCVIKQSVPGRGLPSVLRQSGTEPPPGPNQGNLFDEQRAVYIEERKLKLNPFTSHLTSDNNNKDNNNKMIVLSASSLDKP